MPIHIFLSFAKNDNDKVQSLKEHLAILERNQEIVLLSPNDYPAGTDIETQIQKDLAKSHYFLACLSSKYNSSDDCQKELKMAINMPHQLVIIPLLLQSCDWEYAPFVGKKAIPASGNFIYSQKGDYIDEYCLEVVKNIKELIAQNKDNDINSIGSPLLWQRVTNGMDNEPINFNPTLLDKNDNNMLIGRRADFEKLIAALSPHKPTNIKGIAGIGKTTLVNFYLSLRETQQRFPIVHKIVLSDSRQEKSFDKSVLEKTNYHINTLHEALFLYFLDKIEFGDANHETRLRMIVQYLTTNGKHTLLILDNADSYQDIDKNIRFLKQTNCTILITSRNHIQNTSEIPIEKVSFDAAKKMFAAYNATPYPPEKIESLLKNIDCHTLLIELCAKQLYENATIEIDSLIAAAAQYDFSVLTATNIALSDDTYIETALDKFILYLFKPELLSVEEQQILMYFSLLKNREYPLDKLVQWFTNHKDTSFTQNIPNILLNLSKKGWLQQNILNGSPLPWQRATIEDKDASLTYQNDTNNNADSTPIITHYQCHLIVSYAIRKLLIPTTDNCLSFLENVKIEGHYHQTEHIIDRIQYLPELLHITILFPEEKAIIADILLSIRNFYQAIGDYLNALSYNLQALAIYEKVLGKEHPDTANTYNNIGAVYDNMGDYPQALDYYQQALSIKEKVLEKEHLSTATTYNNIGLVYDNMGDYPQALEYYQQALAIHKKVLGKEHPDTATTYNNIGLVYDNMGDYPQALEYYQQALAICEKVLGKEHPDTATTYNNIAGVYRAMGDYPQALEYYQQALAIREKVLGKEHPDTATTYNNIGAVYRAMGDYPQALEYYQQALSIKEKVLGKEHPSTATIYNNLAWVYEALQEYEKALEYIEKAITIIEKKLPETHPYHSIMGKTRERIKEKIKENEKK